MIGFVVSSVQSQLSWIQESVGELRKRGEVNDDIRVVKGKGKVGKQMIRGGWNKGIKINVI